MFVVINVIKRKQNKKNKMATYVECEKCGNFAIEVIGDRELSCEYCETIAPRSNSSEQSSSSQSEDLICVKEDLLRKSPNSINRTFLNNNIKSNSTTQ